MLEILDATVIFVAALALLLVIRWLLRRRRAASAEPVIELERRCSEVRFLWSMAARANESLNNDLQAKCRDAAEVTRAAVYAEA